MILPVYAYGQKVLKKKAADIEKGYEGLDSLIENMWATMYNAKGVGLAAPQIGLSIRLFLVDTEQIKSDEDIGQPIKKVFINAQMLDESGENVSYEEGCLSIPDIRADVNRNEEITIEYYDEAFNLHKETYSGFTARVIQHEYDHIEGVLFTEKLQPLKRRMIKRRLENIRKGNVVTDYRMKFARL
jgi:peptide deformylase